MTNCGRFGAEDIFAVLFVREILNEIRLREINSFVYAFWQVLVCEILLIST